MATGTRLMQEISDQFLNCKICFENFRDPKTLSCLHTFCCSCLQQQYDQEVSSRTSRYTISIYNRQVTCPLCRKKTDLPTGGVKRLPENFLVCNLTEVLAKRTVSKVPPCEICSTVRGKNVDACSKCLDCSKILCKACVGLHLSTKVTQQHSLIDLEGEKDIQCKSHPDEYVRFFCDPCDACICVVCAFQEHKDHEVCSFSDGSAKYRGSLEALLGKCKERLCDVSQRLNVIEKYETVMKDLRENIRDMAISYIAQVRAKEKELMKRIEEEYGGEIKELVNQKQNLQENMDELQSTCNLTDIMLKDKGVELLLIKKDVEGKMVQLLQPTLPAVPTDVNYDVRFVPGDVALGRLSFGNEDQGKEEKDIKEELIKLERIKLHESGLSNNLSQTNEPDVVTDTALVEKSMTKEMSTSMRSNMCTEFLHTNSQTESKSLMTRDTSTNQVETRERGVFAKVFDMKARGTMTERSDVRSLKCQTDLLHSKEASEGAVTSPTSQGSEVAPTAIHSFGISSPSLAKRGRSGVTQAKPSNDNIKDTVLNQAERRHATNIDLDQQSARGDCRPAPDLLPTSAGISAYSYTPGRKIRSIKIQTEISALDVASADMATDKEFVNKIVESQIKSEKLKQEAEATSSYARLRERPRRVRIMENDSLSATSQSDASSVNGQLQKTRAQATSTKSIDMADKDTCTPVVKLENKDTWTDMLSTSDRATSTDATKTQDRSTGTMALKTGDIGVQIKPYSSAVSTNTATVSTSDHESQTKVSTTDQGTVPDKDIGVENAKRERELAKAAEVLESSVDFITPPQSPAKSAKQTVDRATDPIKMPCASKATETVKIKTVTSSTETPSVKCLDKDTATVDTKTIDQWTETITPQLVSTGVTPPIPATIDVGVATNVILTDEQATCTDIKAYRNSYTETIIVVCDNETLTERVRLTDAQTGMEVCTDNQECETDKLDNTDEGSMTDFNNSWEAVTAETHFTQCEGPSLRSIETNTTRKRRKAKETQTLPVPSSCASCGHIASEQDQPDQASNSPTSAGLQLLEDPSSSSRKKLKDSSTMPLPLDTQDVGTMAISCVTCLHEFQETAIQTSHPKLYDKSSATSFELDLNFLERTLSKDYQDAATSTESLPYIGLLSEIDVDELIVVPEAAFELVSDTDSEYDLIMVDDETSTECLQTIETGTQTLTPAEDAGSPGTSMTDSTGSRGVGEVIKSMVQSFGGKSETAADEPNPKHLVSIGVNTIPKTTFEKETCTPIKYLFSKGTMTFFVSKMDKSTSTFNQARIITGSTQNKTKSEDKITMTTKAEKKHVGVETDTATIDGKITTCISKLRSVSEKLNSPPAKKASDVETFFGTSFTASKGVDSTEKTNGTSPNDKPEEERKRQLNTLLEQTNALLISKDRSPLRKPQPITTLKGRKPVAPDACSLNASNTTGTFPNNYSLKPEDSNFDSKSLPRGFPSERPGTVRMGSQPLSPSRLPLLRYNSAPGRIATVPTQTLLKISGQGSPVLGPNASPKLSKIPISRKVSPPDYQIKPAQQPQATEFKPPEPPQTVPPLRRPLPSITETRTPSSCSDSSTTSYISAESNPSVSPSLKRDPKPAVSNRLSTDSITPVINVNPSSTDPSSLPTLESNRLSADLTTTPSRSPSTSTNLSVTSASLSDSVFRKSSSDTSHSVESNETVEDKTTSEEKTPKKSGMGFMQRLLSRKKKVPETKKEPVQVIKAGPPTAAAVAALASAGPPLPASPTESYAIAHLQHPPHHYPPLPEPHSPQLPRKPRPYVYVQQRLVSIQQDNVEEMAEKKHKLEESKEKLPAPKEIQKDKEKQKDRAKKEVPVDKDKKKKKDEKEKEKSKTKTVKVKTSKTEDKSRSPLPVKKETAGANSAEKK